MTMIVAFIARAASRIATVTALALALCGHCRADDNAEIAALWESPSFKKAFIGGYGINSEIEPRFTPEEGKLLEKLRPLMANDSDLASAEAMVKKALTEKSSAILDFTLAGIQFQQDRLSEALENYRNAVSKFKNFRRAWRNIGLINARNQRNDEAIAAFTKMIELGGGDGISYGLLGMAYAAKSDLQAAEAAYRNALLLQPEEEQWRLGLTRCVFKQQKYEDTAALLDVLIERYPDKPDFWLLQAHAFLGMKQPLKAACNLEAIDLLGKSTVDTLQTLGDIYATESLMDLATRAYERSVDVDTNPSIARPLRDAEVLAARGAMQQSRQLASHIRAKRSQLDEAEQRKLLKLEARLSMADGNSSDETAAVLEEVVKLDPLDGEALMLLGQHYTRRNEPDRAIFYYERAEGIEAFEVTARIRHAQVLVGMSRYKDAIPLLRRAQELKPRDDVARYLDQVERIERARR